jgi:hypothetical protein
MSGFCYNTYEQHKQIRTLYEVLTRTALLLYASMQKTSGLDYVALRG